MISEEAKIGSNTKFWHETLSNIGNCQIGDNCVIHSHVWIGDKVVIGDNVKIQAFSFIPTGVIIGNNVFIGPRVTFTNDKYPPSKDNADWKNTVVMDDVSIGAGAVIVAGVSLNRGAKIGAGAVVTKSVPANETWVGNPAKKLIKRK